MEEEVLLEPAASETQNLDEKNLIAKYAELKAQANALDAQLKMVIKERDDVEAKIISLLDDDEKLASAKYEDLGHVVIVEGAAWASIEKGRQDDVLDFFKENGREDMIKTSVHSSTLSTYVRECLKNNDPLPPGVTFYKPRGLRFYPVK